MSIRTILDGTIKGRHENTSNGTLIDSTYNPTNISTVISFQVPLHSINFKLLYEGPEFHRFLIKIKFENFQIAI